MAVTTYTIRTNDGHSVTITEDTTAGEASVMTDANFWALEAQLFEAGIVERTNLDTSVETVYSVLRPSDLLTMPVSP